MFGRLRHRLALFRKETLVLFYAWRDPATPLWIQLASLALLGYAISPFDLIPDFIPFVGWLDDALIVPGGIVLLVRLLPAAVRQRCERRVAMRRRQGRKGLGWLLLALLLVWLAFICGIFDR